MPTPLKAVPSRPETARERADRLERESSTAAMQIISDLVITALVLVDELESLPSAAPRGMTDELRRMGVDMRVRLTTVEAIRGRV